MLADVVHALKYGRRPSVARALAALMRRAGGELLTGVDVAVPVPLHRRRLRERGFNQAEALARGLGVPLCHALRRARLTPAQVALPGGARRVNLRGAFVLAAAAEQIRGRTVVLVDDVLTTGATVTACADALTCRRAATHRRPHGSPSRERTASLTADRTSSGGCAPSTSCQVGAAAWRR